jgi:eukaryotic-like serine/threonine-protein kinase
LALTPGTRLGAYEILSALGAGGMGEVYRATDTKLKRQVAIKILPPSVAADLDRLARFQREAEVLASLNHPHIAAIYGLEDADGVKALVMELVEGPTLADRIAQGPVPSDEALPIARQIADALEAAHEQGIIHRDLKPANIKVRDDGTVKVLDFGLAKAMEPVGRASNVSQSPTITTPAMTQAGMILGTAAYMSPEQAKGRPTDERSDIWAFGCVLYEILTGKQAFDGEDATDVIASIVKSDPAWNLLPKTTPANVRFLLERCLEKDPKRRLHDMADFRILLDAPPAVAIAPARLPARRCSVLQTIAAATTAATLAGLAVWMLRPEPTRSVRRFPVTLAASVRFSPPAGGRLVALSADGNHLVYAANQRLYLRRMDQLEAEPIRGGLTGWPVAGVPVRRVRSERSLCTSLSECRRWEVADVQRRRYPPAVGAHGPRAVLLGDG